MVSFTPGEIPGALVHLVDLGVDPEGSDLGKLKYMTAGGKLRKIIREIAPDAVNAHYATSYGIAMALSGVKGYALSVWGSDIYDFPRRSFLHRALLQFSLRKAGCLFSTSRAMAEEAEKYTSREFAITPFGVDMDLFHPDKRSRRDDGLFVAGTVKALADKYGIADLLRAAAIVKKRGIPLRLRIAGKGPQEAELKALAAELGIADLTDWVGFIPQEQVAVEWANMDAAVIPSILESESFGVSAVEAQACGTPVIISDIPGLEETAGDAGWVVPRQNAEAIADAVWKLYRDPELRRKMGAEGRRNVKAKYELNHCFEHIEQLLAEQHGDGSNAAFGNQGGEGR